jgi:uncharacterized membrane protein
MVDQRSRNAISAAAITLIIAGGSIAFFLPPLYSHIVHSLWRIILIAIICCICILLHFVFVGIAANRLGRNIALWVLLSICLFPVGSIIGLILFEWFSDEKREPPISAA